MTSATTTGHTMSQSIFGCSKLTNARARALTIAFMWRGPPPKRLQSALNSLPHLRQPLHRNRHGSLQLLGEELHAQLLEQPAELFELRVAVARLELPRLVSVPLGGERRKLRGEARIALRIRAQLVQAQARRLEVAREMLSRTSRQGSGNALESWCSFFCSAACSARIVPASRAISWASSVTRERASSRRRSNSARMRGQGSCMQARSNAAASSCPFSSAAPPKAVNCIAIACRPGRFFSA